MAVASVGNLLGVNRTTFQGGLLNVVGFIDGTVSGVLRPKGHVHQRVVYNGHKSKNTLKYRAINAPDGMMLHVSGPVEGQRHDWIFYIRRGLERNLPEVCDIARRLY